MEATKEMLELYLKDKLQLLALRAVNLANETPLREGEDFRKFNNAIARADEVLALIKQAHKEYKKLFGDFK